MGWDPSPPPPIKLNGQDDVYKKRPHNYPVQDEHWLNDWLCDYCGCLNSRMRCDNCGAHRKK